MSMVNLAATPTPAPGLIKARVLVAGSFGAPDDVVSLAPDALAAGVSAGQLDPHPDAVAYAESMSGEVIEGTTEQRPDDAEPGVQIDAQGLEPVVEKAIAAAPENKMMKRAYTRKAK